MRRGTSHPCAIAQVKPLNIVPSERLLEAIEYQLIENKAPAEGDLVAQFRPRKAWGGQGGTEDASDSLPGVAGKVRPVAVAMRIQRGPD